jgi:hypothetical protein
MARPAGWATRIPAAFTEGFGSCQGEKTNPRARPGGEASGPSRPPGALSLLACGAVAAPRKSELFWMLLHVFLDPGDHYPAFALGFYPEPVAGFQLRGLERGEGDRQLVVGGEAGSTNSRRRQAVDLPGTLG